MQPFEIDADIRRAWTLPSAVYTQPEWVACAREKVFARAWHFLGDGAKVSHPGQVHPVVLLEGCLDEPVVLTRDSHGRLHCISNVCTHRGNLVVESDGRCRSLRCRYHGRRFGLDGRFQSMPEFDGAKDFPSPRDDLPQLQLQAWQQFLFASLEPSIPFEDWIAPVRDRLGWLPFDAYRFDASRSRDYEVRANWALYCDNYLEGFHLPYVHAESLAGVDYRTYRTETFAWGSLQVGLAGDTGDQAVFDLPADSPDAGQRVAAYWFWLFPNLMLNFYPWGLSVNVVVPLAVDRTRVSFLAWVADAEQLGHGAGGALDRVEQEDEAVVANVQRGVGARLYDRGRYSPSREVAVHHFHRVLARSLAAARSLG